FNLQLKPTFELGGNIKVEVLREVEFLRKLGQKGVELEGGFSYKSGGQSGFDIRVEASPLPLFGLPIKGYVELDTRDNNVIIKLFWSPFPAGETDLAGCDFSGLYTVGGGAAHDAAAGRTVRVARGTRKLELAAVGASGPPSVTLTAPNGATVSTPITPDKIQV